MPLVGVQLLVTSKNDVRWAWRPASGHRADTSGGREEARSRRGQRRSVSPSSCGRLPRSGDLSTRDRSTTRPFSGLCDDDRAYSASSIVAAAGMHAPRRTPERSVETQGKPSVLVSRDRLGSVSERLLLGAFVQVRALICPCLQARAKPTFGLNRSPVRFRQATRQAAPREWSTSADPRHRGSG
jgi:hypothetical protein